MIRDTLVPFSKTSVLIVGGGTTGLTTALLLARYGLTVMIVERHHHRSGQPKAHAINPRLLEIFRQIGLDTTRLRKSGVSPEDGDTVRFVVSMAGKEHATLPYERQGPETFEITPEPLFNIPQPSLEDFLIRAVESNENITFYRGVQWESCSQLELGVLSSNIRKMVTGALMVVESAYVLDCGGANSRARDLLGIPFSPLPQYVQKEVHHLSVHFNADLTRFNPGTLWWISSPRADGTVICYDRAYDWIFVTYYNPKTTSPNKFTEHYCRELIDNMPFHPREVFGVNTGIADAQNLAWKIHAVERRWAEEAILSTYSEKRRPVAVANAYQSVKNQIQSFGRLDHVKEKLDCELRANAEHFDSIRLQIGYRYGEDEVPDEPCDYYSPSNKPGSRLVHAWISVAGQWLSTLDLVDGMSFVLLLSDHSARALADAVRSINLPVIIYTLCMGSDFVVLNASWASTVGLSRPASGLLVRPDQHILGNVTSVENIERLLAACLCS
ncbi:FAD binding domain-containing protein [Aspergillus caelatus]|uniref:FAD binding domain-containing protein n=1 Tax=Aspergillus caelatus TaxID=61420 RepID=A0A5N7A052_9EURO|nr:FAD binding domain-containing protein [Aspergillus caelatus]KAE8363241.1 FAD binding domain-containing protein [Aspergillus caelatus]